MVSLLSNDVMNSRSSVFRVTGQVRNLADLSSCPGQIGNAGCVVALGMASLASVSSLALPVCFEPHLFCLIVRQWSGVIAVEICDPKKVLVLFGK